MEACGKGATGDYKGGGRDKGTSTSQMESCVHERLFIMERVENMSHLYVDGLEKVHNNVFNINFTCLILLSIHAFCSLFSGSCISSCVGTMC